MGVDYWKPMIEFIRRTLVEQGTIDPQDVDLLTVTDDLDEAERVMRSGAAMFDVIAQRPMRVLGEKP